MMDEVTIYTDGACLGNPGPGGAGAVLMAGNRQEERSKGYRQPTNHRCDPLGVQAARQKDREINEGYEEELKRRHLQGDFFEEERIIGRNADGGGVDDRANAF